MLLYAINGYNKVQPQDLKAKVDNITYKSVYSNQLLFFLCQNVQLEETLHALLAHLQHF